MSDSRQAGPPSGAPPDSAPRGVSRAVGFGVAAATALIVFAAGAAVFPVSTGSAPARPETPPVASAPAAMPPVASPAPVAAADAGSDTGAGAPIAAGSPPDASGGPDAKEPHIALVEPDAPGDPAPAVAESEPPKKRGKKRKDREREKTNDAPATSAAPAETEVADKSDKSDKQGRAGKTKGKQENVPLPPSDGTNVAMESSKDKEGTVDCALAEKEMAREAWRRNWPTVCPIASSGKAFILIPIKGSIEGETHELRRRPDREARVTLPAGSESQLTLKQYKVKRLGFKELRVSQDGSGATLRVKLLPGAGDPVFEVKDGYAKITVATP